MRRLTLLFVGIGAMSLAAPLPFPKAKDASDLKAMQGQWVATRHTPYKGVTRPDTTISVQGDRMSFLLGGEVRTVWVVTLDRSATPRRMTLRRVAPSAGPAGNLTMNAVYSLDGDTFRFAFGKELPTDLGEKGGHTLYVCKRKR